MAYVRLAKNMIFSLNVMQPPTNAKKGLIRCEVVFGLGDVHEADAVKQFDAVGFAWEVSCFKRTDRSPAGG